MTMFARFRLFHASLAVLAVLAYLSAEWGAIHAWIGYSLAAIFAARLVAAAVLPGVLGRPAWISADGISKCAAVLQVN